MNETLKFEINIKNLFILFYFQFALKIFDYEVLVFWQFDVFKNL